MRPFIVPFFVFFALIGCVVAEERPLQPIERPVIAGETRCLPFFIATTFGGGAATQIIFSYQTPGGSTKRDVVSKAQTVVHIAENKATYEKSEMEENTFRLSPVEYEKAKACLPPPTPEPAKAAQ